MNTRRALWILGIIVLLCLAALAAAKLMPSGKTVLISQDGEVLYTIDLSKVQEPYSITIPWEDIQVIGEDAILVKLPALPSPAEKRAKRRLFWREE